MNVTRIAAVVSICTAALAAQAPPPQQTFRADSRLVRVSVVVQDRSGKPVPGLTAADFEVTESGREQSVSLLAVEDSTVRLNTPTKPGTHSNRFDGTAVRGVTVIVYDRLNTSHQNQQQAKAHIIHYLGQLRPDDRVGFYILESDTIRVMHPISRGVESLIKAVQQTKPEASQELLGSEGPGFGDIAAGAGDAAVMGWVSRADAAVAGYWRERRVDNAIAAFELLARHLAGFPGRKNVIWISDGFPLRFHDGVMMKNVRPEVLAATRAMNGADIAIYPVDARGLPGAFASRAAARQQQFTTLEATTALLDVSELVAERTGGRAFSKTNDLGGAIRRAAEDTSLTYLLGYEPTNADWDGEYRHIKVKVRRPDVTVRHRPGYFAIPPGPSLAQSRDDAIFEALSSPLDDTAIGMQIDVAPDAKTPGRIALTIRLDPQAIVLREQDGRWAGAIDLAIAQALVNSQLAKTVNTTIPLAFAAEMRQRMLKEGLTLNHSIELRDNVHQIRVAVRDPATGAIGTVTIGADHLRMLK